MGQCYTIWGIIKPKSGANMDEIRKVIGLATGGHAEIENVVSCDAYTVKAEFDASYSFESTLVEAFEKAIENTECGSFIEVLGDDWTTRHEIRPNDLASQIATYITDDGCEHTTNGSWAVYFDEIAEHFNVTEEEVKACAEKVVDILDYDVVADVELYGDCFDMMFYLYYCGVEEEDE